MFCEGATTASFAREPEGAGCVAFALSAGGVAWHAVSQPSRKSAAEGPNECMRRGSTKIQPRARQQRAGERPQGFELAPAVAVLPQRLSQNELLDCYCSGQVD